MSAAEAGADGAGPPLGDLPDPVRQRIVSLVAASLPDVAVLPPSLVRIRHFAPARRARAGAGAIEAALLDPGFRGSVGLVVGSDARSDDADSGDDPLTAAARTWITRPDGWEDRLGDSLGRLAERARSSTQDVERIAKLQERVEQAERALREARQAHRDELEIVKAENSRLRRSLGEERRTSRAAREDVSSAAAELADLRAEAATGLAARDREIRQLQARLARHAEDAGADRRAVRIARDEATVRARLLLETVIDAATGLRRELALPSTTAMPSDRLEAGLSTEGVRDPSGSGAFGPDSPALLDHYLAMPRARLVIDGYNVTKSTWPMLSLETQRARLLTALAPLVARTQAQTTVVFDAHQVGSRPVVAAPRGVRVVFSPEGVIADDVIRDLVEVEPDGRVVVVITGDKELAGDVRRLGARTAGAASLLGLLAPDR